MTRPLVSVIIPVRNQTPLVLRCIQSLRNQKRLGEIILMNDASTPEETEILKTITGVRYFQNAGNEGFVKTCNRGAKKAEHDYLLFLNSDTEAYHDMCLEVMARNLDDGAKVCGAKLLYPKNDPYRAEQTQHVGVAFRTDGYPIHILSNMPADTPATNVRRVVPAVTGACFMTPREWWNRLDGFDLKFSPGTLEDVDYCLRTTKLGGEIIYEPESILTHYEHASQDKAANWFTREHLGRNFQYLLQKHGKPEPSDRYWFKGV